MTSRIVIIPARGGSKRIPKKNIKDFLGKPIISYSIENAIKSELFDEIHVSTDDDEIFSIASNLGAKPKFKRSSILAGDSIPIMDVLRKVQEEYENIGLYYDEIWLLMPCAPLLEVTDLISASTLFTSELNSEAMMSVCAYPAPIEWAFNMDTISNKLVPVEGNSFIEPSQSLKNAYFDTGSFCIFHADFIKKFINNESYKNFHGFLLPKHKAVDIDDMDDWLFAEKLFIANKKINAR